MNRSRPATANFEQQRVVPKAMWWLFL